MKKYKIFSLKFVCLFAKDAKRCQKKDSVHFINEYPSFFLNRHIQTGYLYFIHKDGRKLQTRVSYIASNIIRKGEKAH